MADQQPLYENLVYGLAGLTEADIRTYYKDATFGVPAGEVESTIEPRPGVTIVRDNAYGVPHIYGDTRADTMFGAGYAGAQDRLFLMDVLRHTGRAELATFLGGSNADADGRASGASRPYTEADLEKQLDQAPEDLRPQAGRGVEDVQHYVDGINAYIDERRRQPDAEAGRVHAARQDDRTWKPTDVIAMASLIGGIFGRGGGNELHSAQHDAGVRQALREAGRKRAWLGFRSKNDPEAPTTISKAFPYETESAFAKRGPGDARPGHGEGRDRGRVLAARRPAGAVRFSGGSAAASCAPAEAAATPPTGSWSPRSTRRPATRSACSGRRSATTCPRS